MNVQFTKKILAVAVLSATCQISVAASAIDKDKCNASDDVTGWGIWCGVDTYLASQTEDQPTAAGSDFSTTPEIAVETLGSADSELYGGKPEIPESEPSEPVVPPVIPPVVEIELPLKPVEDGTAFRGYWVSSTYEDSFIFQDESFSSQSETGVDIGTLGVTLIDDGAPNSNTGNNDRITQNFYDRNGNQVAALDLEGGDSWPKVTDVNITNDANQPSSAFGFETRTIGFDGGESESGEISDNNELIKNNDEVLKSYWSGGTTFWSNTQNWDIGSSSNETTYTSVYGSLTPLSEIQNLISGNVQAQYSGSSALYRQDVAIDVNFGQESFTGSWTGGTNGAFDFGASGVIQGQNIVSTSISGATGIVQGSFFNENARDLGGAYEVNNGSTTVRDVFATTKGTGNTVAPDLNTSP